MEAIFIVVTCWITFISCGAPEVYEEVAEYPVNIRTVRNPKELHDKALYEPPVFDYRMAKQQDPLRAKYAQQQRVDLARYFKHLRSNTAEKKGVWSGSDEDWKPFTPKVRRVRERSSKDYHENSTRLVEDQSKRSPEAVESKRPLERKDSYIANMEIIYLHPNLLGNPQGTQLNALSDLIGKNPNVQLEGLKRLLQMNGQQRHIVSTIKQPQQFQQSQDGSQQSRMMQHPQSSQQPAQFPQQDAPSSQYNEELPMSISDEDVKNGALEKLQNRLNEAARKQAEDMLIRAQHQAKAQVEAQYKAIEATRQAILEKARNTIQQTTVAVPSQGYSTPAPENNVVFGQSNQDMKPQEYHSRPSPHRDGVLVPQPSPAPVTPIIPLQGYYTTADPEQQYIVVPEPTPVSEEDNERESYSTPPPAKTIMSQDASAPGKQSQVVWVTQAPSPFMVSSTAAPLILSSSNPNHHEPLPTPASIIQIPETYKQQQQNSQKSPLTLKNILYDHEHAKHYAPNHQNLVIEQAKQALVAQIKDQNRAILSKKRVSVARKPTHAYQEMVLEPQQAENVRKVYGHGEDGENYDEDGESEEEQYASKYAFGYRIKDNKEGNDFGHEERRNGKSLEGSYDVLLPDGRRQKVQYYADNSGFHAKVTYENTAHH